jgi:hypothetical protein
VSLPRRVTGRRGGGQAPGSERGKTILFSCRFPRGRAINSESVADLRLALARMEAFEKLRGVPHRVTALVGVGRLRNRGRAETILFYATPARRVLEKVPGASLAHARRPFGKPPHSHARKIITKVTRGI